MVVILARCPRILIVVFVRAYDFLIYAGPYPFEFKSEKTLNHMYNLDSERVRVSFFMRYRNDKIYEK